MSRINWSSNCPKWQARLDAARMRGYFTQEDDQLVMKFATCAIDERAKEVNDQYKNTGDMSATFMNPQTAYDLGGAFAGYVDHTYDDQPKYIKEAQKILDQIKRLK